MKLTRKEFLGSVGALGIGATLPKYHLSYGCAGLIDDTQRRFDSRTAANPGASD